MNEESGQAELRSACSLVSRKAGVARADLTEREKQEEEDRAAGPSSHLFDLMTELRTHW